MYTENLLTLTFGLWCFIIKFMMQKTSKLLSEKSKCGLLGTNDKWKNLDRKRALF